MVRLAVWLLLMAVALLIVARARYSADLSAFLPRSPSATQRLLVQQLQSGLTSRLILIGIVGGDGFARAQASQALARALRARAQFLSVSNGEAASAQQDQQFLYQHRYQLSSAVTTERFSSAGLSAAIADNLELIASPAGLLAKSLFRADPTGETLQVIDQLGAGAQPRREHGVWSSRDGSRALLIAETQAAGSDTDAQAAALTQIRSAFAAGVPHSAVPATAPPLLLLLSGPGVFSVQARATIEQQALRLSLLSTALIATLLLSVYRSLPTLLFGLLPVVSGALVGIAAVALGFGVVHGITLGFGVTLIGESVDYSVYLFIQSQRAHGEDQANYAQRNVLWSTIGLGVLTSICGFASLLPSAFPGLAQLGLFSISGLIAAAAVTRYVLPALLPARLRVADLAPLGARAARLLARWQLPLAAWIALALVCTLLLYRHREQFWNRDLAALSPVSAAAQNLDGQLRADLSAPDISNLVVVQGSDEQQVLQRSEAVAQRLEGLIAQHVIAGYDSPARYLPSQQTQRARLASLPESGPLRARVAAASAALGLQAGALDPFLRDAAAVRLDLPVSRAGAAGTSFALAIDALLWQQAGQWSALLPLHSITSGSGAGAIDMVRVRAALATFPTEQVAVLNVKQELDTLYGSYLAEAIRLSLSGFGAIVLLLLIALRSVRRVARVLAPLVLSVLTVSAALAASGVRLTILHLIGMLLIVAVGSNYALFFDRRAAERDRSRLPLTLASLLIANACTVVGFGVLAFSSVPVLNSLGITVAPGTALALLFAALLAPRTLFERELATPRVTAA